MQNGKKGADIIKCKYCNGEYIQTVYDKAGRCSECGELINPKFIEEKPKKAAKYKKSTSIATPTVANAEKVKKNTNAPQIKNESSAQVGSVIKDISRPVRTTAEVVVEMTEEPKPEIITEASEDIDDLAALGLFPLDVEGPEIPVQETVKVKEPKPVNLEENVKKQEETISAEVQELNAEFLEAESKMEIRSEKIEKPVIPEEQSVTDYEEVDDKSRIKKNKAKIEEFETTHIFNFNQDGFYDDVEPVVPAKPDAISKTIFVKAVGVVVALFLIITFLIYYA